MKKKTEFYKLLEKAVYDDKALVEIIRQIMPIIDKNSKLKNGYEIDEDLKSVLVAYSIEVIKKKEIFKIF